MMYIISMLVAVAVRTVESVDSFESTGQHAHMYPTDDATDEEEPSPVSRWGIHGTEITHIVGYNPLLTIIDDHFRAPSKNTSIFLKLAKEIKDALKGHTGTITHSSGKFMVLYDLLIQNKQNSWDDDAEENTCTEANYTYEEDEDFWCGIKKFTHSQKKKRDRAIYLARKKQMQDDLVCAKKNSVGTKFEIFKSILEQYNSMELYCRQKCANKFTAFGKKYVCATALDGSDIRLGWKSVLPAYQHNTTNHPTVLATVIDAFGEEAASHKDKILLLFTYYMYKLKESNERYWIPIFESEKFPDFLECYTKPDVLPITLNFLKHSGDKKAYCAITAQFEKYPQDRQVMIDELASAQDTLFHNDTGSTHVDFLRQIFRQLLKDQDLNHVVYAALTRHLVMCLVYQQKSDKFSDYSDALYDNYMKVSFNKTFSDSYRDMCARELEQKSAKCLLAHDEKSSIKTPGREKLTRGKHLKGNRGVGSASRERDTKTLSEKQLCQHLQKTVDAYEKYKKSSIKGEKLTRGKHLTLTLKHLQKCCDDAYEKSSKTSGRRLAERLNKMMTM